jgi:hypothetical protein
MIYLVIILVLMVGILGYTTFNLLKKNERAEDTILYYEGYMKEIDEQIRFIDKRIKEIDARGSFQSDDEVGFFFERLKLLNDLLATYKLQK